MHHPNKLFTKLPVRWASNSAFQKTLIKKKGSGFFFPLTAANEKAFHLGVVGHIYGNGESTCNIYSSYRSARIYLLICIYMPTKLLLRSSWENFI